MKTHARRFVNTSCTPIGALKMGPKTGHGYTRHGNSKSQVKRKGEGTSKVSCAQPLQVMGVHSLKTSHRITVHSIKSFDTSNQCV